MSVSIEMFHVEQCQKRTHSFQRGGTGPLHIFEAVIFPLAASEAGGC